MTESKEHPDRIVFSPFTDEQLDKWTTWYRLLGGAWVVLGVLQLVRDSAPLAFMYMAMGLMWWFFPHLNRWGRKRHAYVDHTEVSWPQGFRRHSVLLSDIATVHTDTENPRWATAVILTLTDGSTRRLPTVEPARLLEVIESRIPK